MTLKRANREKGEDVRDKHTFTSLTPYSRILEQEMEEDMPLTPYSKMRVQEMEKHVAISVLYSSMQEQEMEEHTAIQRMDHRSGFGGGYALNAILKDVSAGDGEACCDICSVLKLGLRSLVLESSENLRTTGFAITLMTNAWRALNALGIGNSPREHYPLISRFQVGSSVSGVTSENESPDANE
ncbi:hypothetical protein RHMOL_Rhmol06G0024500 [Rhododendron molle]|uniref:Uncharacterized protein n=1 Tax=Rhododendron molle TaxID=49168 RepID=A0ACC0N822_RHOML|nr:hypothetical protein RHMOL_Rhmol06G0024500 [Rhododendron molle]